MDRTQVEAAITGLIDEVEVAKTNLSAGQDFGLEDISERIAEVCAAATALPEEEILHVQPLLKRLRDDLTVFSGDIDEAKKRAEEEM